MTTKQTGFGAGSDVYRATAGQFPAASTPPDLDLVAVPCSQSCQKERHEERESTSHIPFVMIKAGHRTSSRRRQARGKYDEPHFKARLVQKAERALKIQPKRKPSRRTAMIHGRRENRPQQALRPPGKTG